MLTEEELRKLLNEAWQEGYNRSFVQFTNNRKPFSSEREEELKKKDIDCIMQKA